MGTLGKFALGALAGAAVLAGAAFLYSTFCEDKEDDAEGFAGLEREPDEDCGTAGSAQFSEADAMDSVEDLETA